MGPLSLFSPEIPEFSCCEKYIGNEITIFEGIGEEGANALQQKSCHAGNEVQKIGLPVKPREEPHVRYDSDSKHNTALTLRKIKQESVIREPMKGEKNKFNKNSL